MFAKLLAERQIDRTPMLTVIKQYPKEILLSAFARMAEQAPFYIFTAFVFSYGIGTLHVSRNFLLTAVLSASVLSFVSIPLFGHLSDRIGRKNMYMTGAVVTGIFGFVYFAMLNTGSATIIFVAIILSLIPHDMMYGPQAALIAESFTGRLRYSGSSLGYQLASVIAGGPAPLIATWLFGTYHSSTAIAVYIAVCARDHARRDRADDRLHRKGHQRGGRACPADLKVYPNARGFRGVARCGSCHHRAVGGARAGVRRRCDGGGAG